MEEMHKDAEAEMSQAQGLAKSRKSVVWEKTNKQRKTHAPNILQV
jgi:hypothetical protein